MQTAPEKSLLSLIPDPDSLGRPEKSPEENLQIKSCFTLNLSVSAGIIRDCSCMYSAGTAGHRGTCKAWLVTVYDSAKLGYTFTYLAKVTFPRHRGPSTISPCHSFHYPSFCVAVYCQLGRTRRSLELLWLLTGHCACASCLEGQRQ